MGWVPCQDSAPGRVPRAALPRACTAGKVARRAGATHAPARPRIAGGSDLSDPSSPHGSRPGQHQQQPQQADHHSSDRKAARSTQQTDASAQQLQSSSLAAAAAARSKAAKAVGAANGLPPHVKCFFAGVRWGTLLPPSALKDRASLVAAVSKAFEQDGVRCSEQSAHVIFVTADQQTLEFPGRHKLGDLPRPGEWDAAARRAVRIYVR